MSIAVERDFEHIAGTKDAASLDHDMIRELNERLSSMWRYDQFIADAEDDEYLQDLWREIKQQDQDNVVCLKELIASHVKNNCF